MMTDLTKIEKPFGLLDPETQLALMRCGGPWEVYTPSGTWKTYGGAPLWQASSTYRQAPKPVTYPQPPWEVIDKRWEWFAKDKREIGWFYAGKPEIKDIVWVSCPALDARLLSFDYGTCDWKDSLVRRPE